MNWPEQHCLRNFKLCSERYISLAPFFGIEKQFEQTRQGSEKREKFYPCYAHGEIIFGDLLEVTHRDPSLSSI